MRIASVRQVNSVLYFGAESSKCCIAKIALVAHD